MFVCVCCSRSIVLALDNELARTGAPVVRFAPRNCLPRMSCFRRVSSFQHKQELCTVAATLWQLILILHTNSAATASRSDCRHARSPARGEPQWVTILWRELLQCCFPSGREPQLAIDRLVRSRSWIRRRRHSLDSAKRNETEIASRLASPTAESRGQTQSTRRTSQRGEPGPANRVGRKAPFVRSLL